MKWKSDLELTVTAAAGKRYAPYVRKHLARAHAVLRRPPLRELSLAIVGDARMGALHERFMGVAGPTDVLTFPLDEDARGRVVGGEVIVCVGEARRQARARESCVERELLLYAVHGMLHLCGYDDTTPAAYRAMHAKEDEILERIGVGRVFAPSSPQVAGGGRGRNRGKGD